MADTQALTDFFAAWGETDADRRAKLVEGAVAADFEYADPHAPEPVAGADAFCDYVAEFARNMPGATAEVIGAPDVHHGHARANVRFDFGGGNAMVGQYFADLDDTGRLTRVVGFPGKGAE